MTAPSLSPADRPPKRTWNAAPGSELVPGHRVERRLGGGARTEVYRCTAPEGGGVVAVKVLRPGRTGDRDVRMLAREADGLAALDHDGFPRLRAHDLDADPAWLAVEYVGTTHLGRLVRRRGPRSPATTRALAVGVAGALAHLHDRERVHLDLKPSNVVVGARPVVLDLGASRPIACAARLRPGVGTSAWLSPEQADPGPRGRPGPASDVWGLGATLLYAATGRRPLAARRAGELDEDELTTACLRAASGVPGPVRALVRACLAPDPADRPTAREVADGAA